MSFAGAGILEALKARFGKKLSHQLGTIHKGRNLQRHLPKRWRKETPQRFQIAFERTGYAEAKTLLTESAADSLREAFESCAWYTA